MIGRAFERVLNFVLPERFRCVKPKMLCEHVKDTRNVCDQLVLRMCNRIPIQVMREISRNKMDGLVDAGQQIHCVKTVIISSG